MAAKLTFEAKMSGMEQVLDLLKRAEDQMTNFGRTGSYSIEGVGSRLKEFQQSLETITKSGQGIGGLFKSFDELNRRSNEFLGKSYRGLIDGMKMEVKGFEQEADKVLAKIRDVETHMESMRSRKNAMSEKDYQEGMARHTRELDQLKTQGVAIATEKAQLQREIFFGQPVNQGVHDFASRFGMGQHATVGGALRLGMNAFALPATAGAIMHGAGSIGLQYGYTREADEFLATARLNRSAASAAMSGDPTAILLQRMGAGIEAQGGDSVWAKSKAYGQALLDNSVVRGAGAGVGTFLGLTGSTFGLATIPAIWAGIAAGGTAAATGGNRTYAQFLAEGRGELRNRDLEMYGILGKGAGDQLMRESTELAAMQRIYGMEGTHNLSMTLASQGLSADRANPMINMMLAQGMLPGNYLANADMSGANSLFNRMSLSENVQRSIMRSTALGGGTLSDATLRSMGVFGHAGLTGVQDTAARSALGDYAANLSGARGFGSTDLGVAGSAVAANVSMNAASFNKVEGVQQGIANYESQTKLLEGGSSAMDTIMISKLRMLGVTNAAAIAAFIKLDPRLPTTQERIAAYTGKSRKEVAEAITGAFQSYNNMYETVLGKDQIDKFKQTTGIDMQTLFQSGVKAGENTAGGGATFAQGLVASGAGNVGSGQGVGMGLETMADKQNAAQAANAADLDAKMREILAGTGKTVTDEITRAVIRGFEMTNEEVRKAGDKLIQSGQNRSDTDPQRSQKEVRTYNGPQKSDKVD